MVPKVGRLLVVQEKQVGPLPLLSLDQPVQVRKEGAK
jgi:hypothetical protein